MRWVMRFFLLVLLGFGGLLSIIYPWAAETVRGYDLGNWRVVDRGAGFTEARLEAAPSETPIWISLEVYTDGPIDNPDGAILLTMTTTVDGRTIRAETFTFEGMEPRILSPQSPERLYRLQPLKIVEVEGDAYVFVLGPGEDDFPLIAIDLVAEAGAIDLDPAVPVVGYAIMAISGVLFLLTLRRRRKNPNEMPPPPRWGRG